MALRILNEDQQPLISFKLKERAPLLGIFLDRIRSSLEKNGLILQTIFRLHWDMASKEYFEYQKEQFLYGKLLILIDFTF